MRPTRFLLAACLLALAGCASAPAPTSTALPQFDPKATSPECRTARAAAAEWEANRKPPMNLAVGALMGPYGLALAAASRDHQAKKRRLLARDVHLACSSAPLPAQLRAAPGETG
ncbi:MAG: hypothetical protein M9939_17565 [Mesorhizobium sp.]|nr:hypothetical protein [Mesorhizobium sp.]MCO5162947.1 hypothetical protein [Mesorhizobium sp.]